MIQYDLIWLNIIWIWLNVFCLKPHHTAQPVAKTGSLRVFPAAVLAWRWEAELLGAASWPSWPSTCHTASLGWNPDGHSVHPFWDVWCSRRLRLGHAWIQRVWCFVLGRRKNFGDVGRGTAVEHVELDACCPKNLRICSFARLKHLALWEIPNEK